MEYSGEMFRVKEKAGSNFSFKSLSVHQQNCSLYLDCVPLRMNEGSSAHWNPHLSHLQIFRLGRTSVGHNYIVVGAKLLEADQLIWRRHRNIVLRNLRPLLSVLRSKEWEKGLQNLTKGKMCILFSLPTSLIHPYLNEIWGRKRSSRDYIKEIVLLEQKR